MNSKDVESILNELHQTFDVMNYSSIDEVIEKIKFARRIVCAGVGREGLTCRAFCMRLMHLGYSSHWIWDDTAPSISKGDVFFFTCGSGEIEHLLIVARLAKESGATLICVTGVPDSSAAKLSDLTIFIPASVYKGKGDLVPTIHPMGTLWETASWIFLDSVIYAIHNSESITYEDMSYRHRNYE